MRFVVVHRHVLDSDTQSELNISLLPRDILERLHQQRSRDAQPRHRLRHGFRFPRPAIEQVNEFPFHCGVHDGIEALRIGCLQGRFALLAEDDGVGFGGPRVGPGKAFEEGGGDAEVGEVYGG